MRVLPRRGGRVRTEAFLSILQHCGVPAVRNTPATLVATTEYSHNLLANKANHHISYSTFVRLNWLKDEQKSIGGN